MAEAIAEHVEEKIEEKGGVGLEAKVVEPENWEIMRENYARTIDEAKDRLEGRDAESPSEKVTRMYNTAFSNTIGKTDNWRTRTLLGLENRLGKYRIGKFLNNRMNQYLLGREVGKLEDESKDLNRIAGSLAKENDEYVSEIADLEQRGRELAVDYKKLDSTVAGLLRKKGELDQKISEATKAQAANPWDTEVADKLNLYAKERKETEKELKEARGVRRSLQNELLKTDNRVRTQYDVNANRMAVYYRLQNSKDELEREFEVFKDYIKNRPRVVSTLQLVRIIDFIDGERKKLRETFHDLSGVFGSIYKTWQVEEGNGDNGRTHDFSDVKTYLDNSARRSEERVNSIVEKYLA